MAGREDYDFGNPFQDTYDSSYRQGAQRVQERREAEERAMRMSQAIEAMQEQRRQRQFGNLESALKFEGNRAQAGLEELPGPPRPGDVAVFKNQNRAPVDFGELPGGIDPAEIARIADAHAKRLESDRIRKQTEDDFQRDLKMQQEQRKVKADEALIDLRRSSAERNRRPPAPKAAPELNDNDLRSYRADARRALSDQGNIEPTDDDIEAEMDRQIASDQAALQKRRGGGGGGGGEDATPRPTQRGQKLSRADALVFVRLAGGDKKKAMQMAIDEGWNVGR